MIFNDPSRSGADHEPTGAEDDRGSCSLWWAESPGMAVAAGGGRWLLVLPKTSGDFMVIMVCRRGISIMINHTCIYIYRCVLYYIYIYVLYIYMYYIYILCIIYIYIYVLYIHIYIYTESSWSRGNMEFPEKSSLKLKYHWNPIFYLLQDDNIYSGWYDKDIWRFMQMYMWWIFDHHGYKEHIPNKNVSLVPTNPVGVVNSMGDVSWQWLMVYILRMHNDSTIVCHGWYSGDRMMNDGDFLVEMIFL